MASVDVIRKTEYLINGEWQVHEEATDTADTYENLIRRQGGNADLPHLKRVFKNRQKIETQRIVAMGEVFFVRNTLSWV